MNEEFIGSGIGGSLLALATPLKWLTAQRGTWSWKVATGLRLGDRQQWQHPDPRFQSKNARPKEI